MKFPNCMPFFDPPTGPPFTTNPPGPFALIVTELLRLWSAEPPFAAEELCAMAGAATAGTAGKTDGLPFTSEIELAFACCCTAADPAPSAIAGETAFFAVEA